MDDNLAQRVVMIPIAKVTVLNPRARNKRGFEDFVENISSVGLKRPITVTRRNDGDDEGFDLVCGQGRLEAFIALGQSEVPALIVSAEKEDCLVASLVENCARRHHKALDLLQDIRGMEERGFSQEEIARKTGLTRDYVSGVSRLIARGEQRLLRSVESGQIPLSVAVDIAEASDQDVQAALSHAYERGLLKGKRLLAARKLIESRRRLGKGLVSASGPRAEPMSASALVKAYEEDAARKRALIERAHSTRDRLLFILEAIRRLAADKGFLEILEDENIATFPKNLAARLSISAPIEAEIS